MVIAIFCRGSSGCAWEFPQRARADISSTRKALGVPSSRRISIFYHKTNYSSTLRNNCPPGRRAGLATEPVPPLLPPEEYLGSQHLPNSPASLVALFDENKLQWASKDSTMSLYNVRLHLRVLRRLSMAVADPAAPSYTHSALHYFDRNEEIWGRRTFQVVLQESPRYLDAFTGAIPDLGNLRLVAEALHVMYLRGYNVKPSGRQAADTAKSILTMCKVWGSIEGCIQYGGLCAPRLWSVLSPCPPFQDSRCAFNVTNY